MSSRRAEGSGFIYVVSVMRSSSLGFVHLKFVSGGPCRGVWFYTTGKFRGSLSQEADHHLAAIWCVRNVYV